MLSLCAVNEVMPGRRSVFKNWADYCSVEMEKLFIWNSRSLKLVWQTNETTTTRLPVLVSSRLVLVSVLVLSRLVLVLVINYKHH